jgi:hypothetical protein
MENNLNADFQFCFSEDHLITSFLRHEQQNKWLRPIRKAKWSLGLLLIAATVLAVLAGFGSLGAASGAMFVILFIGRPIELWQSCRRFRKSPFHNDEVAFSLSDGGAHIRGNSSELKVGWPIFTKARRFEDGLLLYQGPGVFNWLPDSSALDTAAILNAQAFARSKIQDYREM